MKKTIALSILLTIGFIASARTNNKTDDLNNYKNSLQWNISYMTRGVFSLSYERLISPKAAIQFSVGATSYDIISISDFPSSFFEEINPFNDTYDYDTYSYTYDTNEPEYTDAYQGGAFGSIGIKVYLRNNVNLKGLYIKPQFRYRNYFLTTNVKDDDNNIDFDRTKEMNEFGFTIGYQTGGYLTWNFYIGAGYLMKVSDEIITETITTYDTWGYEYKTYSHSMKKQKQSIPNPWGGVSVGFAF